MTDPTAKPYRIRRPERHEIPAIAEIGAQLFIETFGHLYTAEDLQAFLNRVHSPQGVTQDWDAGLQFWIAECEGRFIGYCKGGKLSLPVDPGSRRAFELKQMYVAKEHHGRGPAHDLMQSFLDWAHENQADDLYISCWSENARGLAFYKKYGFEIISSYTFWVGNQGDDERILKRSLR